MQKILYISYDGMTDPLGPSQVIPYVEGLAAAGYDMTILSCEKKDKYFEKSDAVKKQLSSSNIKWQTFFFTSKPPVLSKIYDLANMKRMAILLHKKNKYDMTHCRSYVSAEAGLLLKKKYGVKFLFDIRGFWVDERVEGGMWNLKNPFYRYAFNKYKKKEAEFIAGCDGLVSLTENGKKEMLRWESYHHQPLYVIPCSADFNLFSLTSEAQKKTARQKLGISDDKLVMSYLGSVGTWYLMDEMFDFFSALKKKYSNAVFLWVTNSNFDVIKNRAIEKNISPDDLVLTHASRKEVPELIKACNFSISFIKACYSKKSSSPTKQGELLAMGIPVICNSGVGDVKEIIENTKGGICIDDFSNDSFNKAITDLDKILSLLPAGIRERAFEYYDLKKAQQQYINLYKEILD